MLSYPCFALHDKWTAATEDEKIIFIENVLFNILIWLWNYHSIKQFLKILIINPIKYPVS